jgi:hypothetical protein
VDEAPDALIPAYDSKVYTGLPAGEYPGDVEYAFGSVWFSNWTTNDVWRVSGVV